LPRRFGGIEMPLSARRITQAVHFGAPLCYRGLRALGVPAVNRRLQDAGLILCYHNVVPSGAATVGDPGIHMSRERFEKQMRWLVGHYTVLGLGEFVDRLSAGKSLRSVAAVTFDDGYAGVFENAIPLLRALAIPATVFVVGEAGRRAGFWWDQPEIVETADPGRRREWLNKMRGDEAAIWPGTTCDLPASHRPAGWEIIREAIRDGIEIGAHSVSHRSLTTLSDVELEHEVVSGRTMIQRATGTRPESFAYPYGLWDLRIRSRVRLAGYRAGLTLDYGLNRPFADPCSLRRLNVPAGISDAAFESWAAGLTVRRRS
jgi:peptidoglycan/xylan/chitin deacetylase (PgdA/CDA1 family)